MLIGLKVECVLYKYLTDTASTKAVISGGQIFLAKAHQLNDPFECTLQVISQDWIEAKTMEGMQAALASFLYATSQEREPVGRFFGLRPARTKAAIQEVFAAGDFEATYVAMRAFMKKRTGNAPNRRRVRVGLAPPPLSPPRHFWPGFRPPY